MVIKTDEGILDIYEGIKYPFNYAIGDVRDITKRNIDFSKTIKLPATKNINLVNQQYRSKLRLAASQALFIINSLLSVNKLRFIFSCVNKTFHKENHR